MDRIPTFASALVAALRRNGSGSRGPGGPTWAEVADDARRLSLGLLDAGWADGVRVRVRPTGLDPAERIARELAVLAAGSVLVVDGPADVEVAGDRVTGPHAVRSCRALRAAGSAVAASRPDAHEHHLDALPADAVAVVGRDLSVSQGQLLWALRSVDAWLGGTLAHGVDLVLAAPADPEVETLAEALVGRWWPSSTGAALLAVRRRGAELDVARAARPDLVVLGPAGWAALAEAVRDEAGRSRAGRTALRSARLDAAGEGRGGAERTAARAARRWSRVRLARAAGLDRVGAGVCLGPLGIVDGRDLGGIGVPVASTWIDPAIPAPVAATPFGRCAPDGWGRPLPGRVVEVGRDVRVLGGDVGADGMVALARTRVDDRGRVAVGASGR